MPRLAGSFATTTTLFKLTQMVPEEQLPETLNVGHTLPTILQAILICIAGKGQRRLPVLHGPRRHIESGGKIDLGKVEVFP